MSETTLQVLIKLFLLLEYLEVGKITPTNKSKILRYFSRFGLEITEEDLNKYYLSSVQSFDERISKSFKIDEIILKICTRIDEDLLPNDKVFIIFCLFEYALIHQIAKQHVLKTTSFIGGHCKINQKDIDTIRIFINSTDVEDFRERNCLVAKRKEETTEDSLEGAWVEKNMPHQGEVKQIVKPDIDGVFVFVFIQGFNGIAFKYLGEQKYVFRDTEIVENRFYFFENHDCILKGEKPILHYREVAQVIFSRGHALSVVLTGKGLEYNPRLSLDTIKRFTFSEKSGNLIGLVSESARDKNILFQCLAGRVKPTRGSVNINGFDTYHDRYKLQGVIGYIPDVPLLFEQLTVYENFHYHVKLHYRHIDRKQVNDLVMRIINELGLQSIKDLKWNDNTRDELGNYQVKLINLGVELIRDPYVIFFAEPFKGLQTSEIQKLLNILRELCMRGKLIVVSATPPLLVNIREFDKLWIFDGNGYPIFNGNPDRAHRYFREKTETELNIKGFFERKQATDIWQMVSEKEINKQGKQTKSRKIKPEKWHKTYLEQIEPEIKILGYRNVLPRNFVNIPDIDKQFRIYLIRDIWSRVGKTLPYIRSLAMVLVLAVITGFFGRFSGEEGYVFSENRNMLFYLFTSVFNAFIIGIWCGREEIHDEFRIIERDSVLLLSKYSYLNSKLLIMTVTSLILIGLYTIVGNTIVGVFYMSFRYWLVLSAVAISGVVIGLNLSLLSCTYRCMYFILSSIIFLQILFSGKVVPFGYFPEPINNKKYVNILGDVSVIRWGFEALVVEQFKNNKFEKVFFDIDFKLSEGNYALNHQLPLLDDLLTESVKLTNRENPQQILIEKLTILRNALTNYGEKEEFFPFEFVNRLSINDFNDRIASETRDYITYLSYAYFEQLEDLEEKKENMIDSIGAQKHGELKSKYFNQRISDEVRGPVNENAQIVEDYEIIRKIDPIFHYPGSNIGRAHIYAPSKMFNGQYVDTIYFNIVSVLMLSLVMYVFLMTGGPEYISRWITFTGKQHINVYK